MKKEEFFPKVTIVGKNLVFNVEALETMELDSKDAKVIMIETTNEEKKTNPKELLIMKTNGSACDDLENVKDVFPPEHIRPVSLEMKDGEIVSGAITLNDSTIEVIEGLFGKGKNEFKLLVANTESPPGKELKEQFDITSSYYKFAYVNDKRVAIGRNKDVKATETEERISIN
jgi:hypothetical protein